MVALELLWRFCGSIRTIVEICGSIGTIVEILW